jgi:DNA-binding helix-hairpin-helix protein with protein kinase domain
VDALKKEKEEAQAHYQAVRHKLLDVVRGPQRQPWAPVPTCIRAYVIPPCAHNQVVVPNCVSSNVCAALQVKADSHVECVGCGHRVARTNTYCPVCGTKITTNASSTLRTTKKEGVGLDSTMTFDSSITEGFTEG